MANIAPNGQLRSTLQLLTLVVSLFLAIGGVFLWFTDRLETADQKSARVRSIIAPLEVMVKRNGLEIDKLRIDQAFHAEKDGHAPMVERVDGVKAQLDRLETKMDRILQKIGG